MANVGGGMKRRWWQIILFWWYRWRHNIRLGMLDGTIPPRLGNGPFVSVHRRGSIIDVTSHRYSASRSPAGMIRLIPVQYKHGFMVEYFDRTGEMLWRTHLSYDDLYEHGAGAQEASRDHRHQVGSEGGD